MDTTDAVKRQLSGCIIIHLTRFHPLASLYSRPGAAYAMGFAKYSIPTEVRKSLRGKRTKVDIVVLFHAIAPQYLRMLKAEAVAAGGQKGVDELERLFRLEDPRD